MLDGRLALTTPEGVRLQLTPAGPYLRAAAWSVDFAIWLGFVLAMASLLGAAGKLGQGITMLLLFVSYWGYPILCEVYWGGRTLGKRAAGIEVLRADGLPVGWRESSLRNLMLVADFLPFMYASGLVCMLCDLQFRRLGDIVAGTQVVHSEKKAALRPAAPSAEPLPLPFPLSAQQQRTLADLFEREAGLPPERMLELGSLASTLTGLEGAASVERLRRYAAGLAR
ncbi:MAG: RDD family protein [Pseudomonadota bacterium]